MLYGWLITWTAILSQLNSCVVRQVCDLQISYNKISHFVIYKMWIWFIFFLDPTECWVVMAFCQSTIPDLRSQRKSWWHWCTKADVRERFL